MMMDWDTSLFRAIHVGMKSPAMDNIIRVVADTGLGQVQAAALLWAWMRPWLLKRGQAWFWGGGVVLLGLAQIDGYGWATLIAAVLMMGMISQWPSSVARVALISAIIAGIIRLGVVKIFNRPRPSNLGFGTPLEPLYGPTSFPSGHATTTSAIATIAIWAMIRGERNLWADIALLWMLLVGFARVYSGVHYPTDAMAGWCLGAMVGTVVWLWLGPTTRLDDQDSASTAATADSA